MPSAWRLGWYPRMVPVAVAASQSLSVWAGPGVADKRRSSPDLGRHHRRRRRTQAATAADAADTAGPPPPRRRRRDCRSDRTQAAHAGRQIHDRPRGDTDVGTAAAAAAGPPLQQQPGLLCAAALRSCASLCFALAGASLLQRAPPLGHSSGHPSRAYICAERPSPVQVG